MIQKNLDGIFVERTVRKSATVDMGVHAKSGILSELI